MKPPHLSILPLSGPKEQMAAPASNVPLSDLISANTEHCVAI